MKTSSTVTPVQIAACHSGASKSKNKECQDVQLHADNQMRPLLPALPFYTSFKKWLSCSRVPMPYQYANSDSHFQTWNLLGWHSDV